MSLIRLLTVLVFLVGPHRVLAQNEPDDFLDDDEPFDEQVDDKGGQHGPGPRSRGPTTPVQTPIHNTPPQSTGSSGGPTEDVTFHLTDPPKYWQPKKRHHRNQAEDQKDSRLNAKAEADAIKAKADEKSNTKQ